MESLESLRQRIASAQDLLSVVKTMKTLAAANIRQYERAVTALAEYNRTLEMGLQITLRQKPAGIAIGSDAKGVSASPLGAVVFGSDQGLCGQFNERIANYTVDTLNGMHVHHHDRALMTVGRRLTNRLENAGQTIEDAFALPGSVQGIGPAVQRLLIRIEAWRLQGHTNRIVLFYNKTAAETSYAPQRVQLFPLDLAWLERLAAAPWPPPVLPVIFMDWQPLLRGLLRQYIFVALYRAFAESLASENASRLASMQAAERNIQDHLAEFHAAYQQQRQNAITSELLDIVGGFEALTQP